MIAALFVEAAGVYARPDIDLWDIDRDARTYAGPWPVVAHPPCERWGRYWSGGPSARVRRTLGDDGGCFLSALSSVRRWGGVLEHPEASHAWRYHGLTPPPKSGRWVRAGDDMGWTCCVEQGHYGHAARKATWLYACGTELPDLTWGSCGPRGRLEPGFHSAAERAAAPPERRLVKRLSRAQRVGTPPQFAELLLSIAATAGGSLRRCVAARTGTGGSRTILAVNPAFIERLMGAPPSWTDADLPRSATRSASSRRKQP